jgi:diaminopimelate decarboxylase
VRDAVAALIARCERATLVFDAARIAANMQRIADAARAARITPLFAVKSFPHPRVIELAARYFDGFDVASRGELAIVPHDKLISIADPTGSTTGTIAIGEPAGTIGEPNASGGAIGELAAGARTIIVCETIEQVRAASGDIAIRVSASITGRDPAVGAILDGTGHRRSRFGLDTREAIATLRDAARGRVGLHIHHGPVTAVNAERFIATAGAAIELAGFAPDFLDLGGAWHGVSDIAAAFAQIRAAFDMPILVEPGRACAEGAGFAVGRVMSRRELDDRILVVSDLSRVCHLRWSQVELVAKAPHPGTGRKLLVTGATCYEEDIIGEWTVGDLGDRIVLRNVSGYAYAWNTSFGGVPAADVVLVDD